MTVSWALGVPSPVARQRRFVLLSVDQWGEGAGLQITALGPSGSGEAEVGPCLGSLPRPAVSHGRPHPAAANGAPPGWLPADMGHPGSGCVARRS